MTAFCTGRELDAGQNFSFTRQDKGSIQAEDALSARPILAAGHGLLSPVAGRKLAGLLRKCHAYITASLWEPCGMHHVEGAQCGLPLLYHEDGGGIVEAGKRYGIGFLEESLESAIGECGPVLLGWNSVLRLRTDALLRRGCERKI